MSARISGRSVLPTEPGPLVLVKLKSGNQTRRLPRLVAPPPARPWGVYLLVGVVALTALVGLFDFELLVSSAAPDGDGQLLLLGAIASGVLGLVWAWVAITH